VAGQAAGCTWTELGLQLGYPFSILLVLLLGVGLYAIFKRRGWL